jgi:poly(3-hydroxybutyrate) depolymerase
MAADKPDLIAAAAAVGMSTSFLVSNPTTDACPSSRRSCNAPPVEGVETERYGIGDLNAPVPVFLLRGGQDLSVCPDGTCSRTGRRYDTLEEQVEKWLTNNDCDASSVQESTFTGKDGDKATLRRFESCSSGAPVHFLYMPALDHSWPNAANEIILEFLMQAELD